MRLRRAATDQPHALLLPRRFALPDKNQALNLPVASCLVTRAPIGSVKEDGSRAFVIRPYTPISAETTGHLDLVGCWRGVGDVDGGGGGKRGLIGWHDSGQRAAASRCLCFVGHNAGSEMGGHRNSPAARQFAATNSALTMHPSGALP